MAYTTPPTFVASDVLEADQLNILSDDISYLKGITDGVTYSAVQVTRAANTSISDSTWTPVTWTAEVIDYGGWYTSGTDIVVPAGAVPAGYTSIAVLAIPYNAQFDNNATGIRGARVMLNGSTALAQTQAGFASDDTVVNSSGQIIVEAGDVLTLEVYQSSGGALNAYAMSLTIVRFVPVA